MQGPGRLLPRFGPRCAAAIHPNVAATFPPLTRVLGAPGQPAPDADADILLVPAKSADEGDLAASPAAAACPVPLPLGVWL